MAGVAIDTEFFSNLSAKMEGDLKRLEEDIFAIAPKQIGEVQVECTIVGGRVVFER